jgi:CHAT domain-containing protein
LRDVCSVQDIQRQVLDDKAMLLQYHLAEKRSVLLLVTASSLELFTLPGRAEIERSLRAYLKMISERMVGSQDGEKASERIAQELLPFVSRKEFRGAKRLIVIPDGILHYLPFETLRTVSANGARYLIEDYALSYCPSASSLLALRALRKNKSPRKDLLAVGAPRSLRRTDRSKETALLEEDGGYFAYRGGGADLPSIPFSREEVLEVAKTFPKKRALVLLGEAASEDAVKTLPLDEFRIIHLACHGLLDEAHPFRSALVLSRKSSGEDDGLLQMREIYGLTTNADVVVLSACQTARGRLELAEGTMGLARPFFFTGARSVLASMWAVNDKAAVLLMREFYRQLRAGRAAADALRLAKMKFLKGPRSQPFYWASFVLIGNHEVTVSRQ